MMIYFQGSFMIIMLSIISSTASRFSTTNIDMVTMAGYGEDKLSTVLVSGALICHRTHNSPLPIPGALVVVQCHTDGKLNRVRGKTDEYGDFVVDLPSHLHAIPNIEKRCRVTIVWVPKKSPCHRAAGKRKHTALIKFSSSTNGIRTYSTHEIHLTPSHRSRGRKTHTSHSIKY